VGPGKLRLPSLVGLIDNADAMCWESFLGHCASNTTIAPRLKQPLRIVLRLLHQARSHVDAQCVYGAIDCQRPASGRRERPRALPRPCARSVQGQEVCAASAMERQLCTGVATGRTAVQEELSRRTASGVSRIPSAHPLHGD
jgi:hypothetical protein